LVAHDRRQVAGHSVYQRLLIDLGLSRPPGLTPIVVVGMIHVIIARKVSSWGAGTNPRPLSVASDAGVPARSPSASSFRNHPRAAGPGAARAGRESDLGAFMREPPGTGQTRIYVES